MDGQDPFQWACNYCREPRPTFCYHARLIGHLMSEHDYEPDFMLNKEPRREPNRLVDPFNPDSPLPPVNPNVCYMCNARPQLVSRKTCTQHYLLLHKDHPAPPTGPRLISFRPLKCPRSGCGGYFLDQWGVDLHLRQCPFPPDAHPDEMDQPSQNFQQTLPEFAAPALRTNEETGGRNQPRDHIPLQQLQPAFAAPGPRRDYDRSRHTAHMDEMGLPRLPSQPHSSQRGSDGRFDHRPPSGVVSQFSKSSQQLPTGFVDPNSGSHGEPNRLEFPRELLSCSNHPTMTWTSRAKFEKHLKACKPEKPRKAGEFYECSLCGYKAVSSKELTIVHRGGCPPREIIQKSRSQPPPPEVTVAALRRDRESNPVRQNPAMGLTGPAPRSHTEPNRLDDPAEPGKRPSTANPSTCYICPDRPSFRIEKETKRHYTINHKGEGAPPSKDHADYGKEWICPNQGCPGYFVNQSGVELHLRDSCLFPASPPVHAARGEVNRSGTTSHQQPLQHASSVSSRPSNSRDLDSLSVQMSTSQISQSQYQSPRLVTSGALRPESPYHPRSPEFDFTDPAPPEIEGGTGGRERYVPPLSAEMGGMTQSSATFRNPEGPVTCPRCAERYPDEATKARTHPNGYCPVGMGPQFEEQPPPQQERGYQSTSQRAKERRTPPTTETQRIPSSRFDSSSTARTNTLPNTLDAGSRSGSQHMTGVRPVSSTSQQPAPTRRSNTLDARPQSGSRSTSQRMDVNSAENSIMHQPLPTVRINTLDTSPRSRSGSHSISSNRPGSPSLPRPQPSVQPTRSSSTSSSSSPGNPMSLKSIVHDDEKKAAKEAKKSAKKAATKGPKKDFKKRKNEINLPKEQQSVVGRKHKTFAE